MSPRPTAVLFASQIALGYLPTSCRATPPVVAEPPHEPAPIHRFSGEVFLPGDTSFEYLATFMPDPEHAGQFLGSIDIPKHALSAGSLYEVDFDEGRRVSFQLALPGTPRWEATYTPEGALRCAFRQGELVRKCSMVSVDQRTVRK